MPNVFLVSRPKIDFAGLFDFLKDHTDLRKALTEEGMVSSDLGVWKRCFEHLEKEVPEQPLLIAIKLPHEGLLSLVQCNIFPVATLDGGSEVVVFLNYPIERWVSLIPKLPPRIAEELYKLLQPMFKDFLKSIKVFQTKEGYTFAN